MRNEPDETFESLRRPILFCRGARKVEPVTPENVAAWLRKMAHVCRHREYNALCGTCRDALKIAETVDRVGPVTVHPAR